MRPAGPIAWTRHAARVETRVVEVAGRSDEIREMAGWRHQRAPALHASRVVENTHVIGLTPRIRRIPKLVGSASRLQAAPCGTPSAGRLLGEAHRDGAGLARML